MTRVEPSEKEGEQHKPSKRDRLVPHHTGTVATGKKMDVVSRDDEKVALQRRDWRAPEWVRRGG